MIPCKDCITLGMCKGEAIRRYEEKAITHSRERLTDNVILNLALKCSLIHDHVGFQDARGLDISKERLVIADSKLMIYKGIKRKMNEVKLFFNMPLGDDYGESNM